jgi:hypothetical protein
MAKKLARGPESYKNEELVLELVPELLLAKGFHAIKVRKPGGMKLIEASDRHGYPARFWLKQGWSTTSKYSAIQFGMFEHEPNPGSLPDSYFVDFVAARTVRAKERGATHALMIHMFNSTIQTYLVLAIDDIPRAYADQIAHCPARARNTKTPTLFFKDDRNRADAYCVNVVTDLEIPLEAVSGAQPPHEVTSAAGTREKITAEIERRFQQRLFRLRVGGRCGWRCSVSGVTIREVLDAAHLPGRNWRENNEATDGILLRSDLHRLLDQGLAEIRGGKFIVHRQARIGEYAAYHGRIITPEISPGI